MDQDTNTFIINYLETELSKTAAYDIVEESEYYKYLQNQIKTFVEENQINKTKISVLKNAIDYFKKNPLQIIDGKISE